MGFGWHAYNCHIFDGDGLGLRVCYCDLQGNKLGGQVGAVNLEAVLDFIKRAKKMGESEDYGQQFEKSFREMFGFTPPAEALMAFRTVFTSAKEAGVSKGREEILKDFPVDKELPIVERHLLRRALESLSDAEVDIDAASSLVQPFAIVMPGAFVTDPSVSDLAFRIQRLREEIAVVIGKIEETINPSEE